MCPRPNECPSSIPVFSFCSRKYESVIAVLVTYVATQIGFGSSWMNPFSVGIAQGIAGIDVFSGAGFRMVMWVVFTALGCGMTMFYASKIKKNPTISIAYKTDSYFREQNETTGIDEGHSFGLGHILVLLTLAVTVVWVVWGVMTQGYYMPEIATAPETPDNAFEILYIIVLITVGVVGSEPPRTCMIPCAIATTRAAPIRSFAPSLKDVAISFSFIFP